MRANPHRGKPPPVFVGALPGPRRVAEDSLEELGINEDQLDCRRWSASMETSACSRSSPVMTPSRP
jgi:hypothetical protein